MNDGRDVQSGNRTLSVMAYGNTPEEIELAALDEARAFFGPDIRLRVRPDYGVSHAGSPPAGEKYMARMTVETIGGTS